MATRYFASRTSLNAQTDFDFAMANVELGPFASKSEAFGEMVKYLWTKEGDTYAEEMLQEVSDDPEGDKWTVRTLRWQIRSI